MNKVEFTAWPKTPRLFRDCVITEKIDGTNAAVVVMPYPFGTHVDKPIPVNTRFALGPWAGEDGLPETEYLVYAQSRKRILTPDADNYGFAGWVWANAETLAVDLGPGRHYGEWWGKNIQRGYGMPGRVLSLFNTAKWAGTAFTTAGLNAVPVITKGTFNTSLALSALDMLRENGSLASPGFKPAEGICVYHSASGSIFKALLESDELPKSLAA